MKEVYTLTQLKEAWEDYKTKRVMVVMKDGKSYIRHTGTSLGDDITSARVVTCKEAMGFPLFLEKYYK